MAVADLVARVISNLSDDLRKAPWRGSTNLMAGHCYVVAETLYHLGGAEGGFRLFHMTHEGASHWFLQNADGDILDPTVGQFSTVPDYNKARHLPFLTQQPSSRAQMLMQRVTKTGVGVPK